MALMSHLPLCPLPQGVLGSSSSGKSALVHRFLTGSYVSLEPTESEWLWGGMAVGWDDVGLDVGWDDVGLDVGWE